jgi:CHASE2 domain-containing sensor protein
MVNHSVEELLQQCTVKITVPEQHGHGTGFFVAPRLILTCAHVVKALEDKKAKIRWQDQENFAEAEIEQIHPSVDLALLRVTTTHEAVDIPCVYLDESLQTGDELYLFGYPDQDFPNGCPVTFNCEGLTGDEPPLIKFKLGQVRPGMSGSALLNRRTQKVCGIVKFTRDRSLDIGGGAVPTGVILSRLSDLKGLQKQFHKRDRRWQNFLQHYKRPSLVMSALTEVGVVIGITTLRLAGLLQSWELLAYDWLFQTKPFFERPDDRIVLVTITNDEIDQLGTSEISDRKLKQILENLVEVEPFKIGLDIFRDEAQADPEALNQANNDYQDLIEFLDSDLIVATCQVGSASVPGSSFPSEEVRLGFSNIVVDKQGRSKSVRRQLISMPKDSNANCQASYSLGYQLALDYLEKEGITERRTESLNYIQLGDTVFEPIWSNTGGYQGIDDSGYQILINYRRAPFHRFFASEILDGLDANEQERIKDRIVLVGYDEEGATGPLDLFETPLGIKPGVELHAHITSHVLSTVINDEYSHPLIRTWAEPEEIVWITLWCTIGGTLPWIAPSKGRLFIITVGGVLLVVAICWSVFAFWGWWLPLIPSTVGLMLTSVGAVVMTEYQILQKR